MSNEDATTGTQTLIEKSVNVRLTAAYLYLMCLTDSLKPNIGLARIVNAASDASKRAIIDDLSKIGAIEYVAGRWQPTEKGREINEQLGRRLNGA